MLRRTTAAANEDERPPTAPTGACRETPPPSRWIVVDDPDH
jgi:hypothetical protein